MHRTCLVFALALLALITSNSISNPAQAKFARIEAGGSMEVWSDGWEDGTEAALFLNWDLVLFHEEIIRFKVGMGICPGIFTAVEDAPPPYFIGNMRLGIEIGLAEGHALALTSGMYGVFWKGEPANGVPIILEYIKHPVDQGGMAILISAGTIWVRTDQPRTLDDTSHLLEGWTALIRVGVMYSILL